MKNSNTKEVIAKVQNHMIRQIGSKRALYEEIENAKRSFGGVRYGLINMVDGGLFLIYNKDVYNFLHRIGYTKAQLDKMDVWNRYRDLIVRDGIRFYDQYVKALKSKKR